MRLRHFISKFGSGSI